MGARGRPLSSLNLLDDSPFSKSAIWSTFTKNPFGRERPALSLAFPEVMFSRFLLIHSRMWSWKAFSNAIRKTSRVFDLHFLLVCSNVCVVSRALMGIETLLPWKEECCSAFCRGIILLYALLSSGLLPLSLFLLFFFLRIFDGFFLLSRAAIAQYDNVILLLIFTANSL